jgi:hypothetical protein
MLTLHYCHEIRTDASLSSESRRTYESKHERFFARLREMPHPWGLAGQEPPTAPSCGRDIAADVSLNKRLGKGIRGFAYYRYRYPGLAEDIGMNDDFVTLEFNPEKVDYQALVREALPAYIEAFNGHISTIKDEEFTELDFDAWQASGKDGRNGVYRVMPVSFYDRLLCQRAFGQSPEQIAARLSGRIEDVRLFHDGVYLIGSSQPLPLAEADKLSWDMKRWIMEG